MEKNEEITVRLYVSFFHLTYLEEGPLENVKAYATPSEDHPIEVNVPISMVNGFRNEGGNEYVVLA